MSSNIKIYYSIPEEFPPFRLDISELFSQSLAQKGLDITWYMRAPADHPTSGKFEYFSAPCFMPPKIKNPVKLGKLINKCLYWSFDIYYLAKSMFSGYEIIQVRDKYFAALLGLFFSKLSGNTFIYWCSYPYPEHTLNLADEAKGIKKILLKVQGKLAEFILYKIVIKHANHTFVQSLRMLEDIQSMGVSPEKMTPVPMGVPERVLSWARDQEVQVLPNTVAYVGTLSAVRRLHAIIEAFSLVVKSKPDAILMMVGDGDNPSERQALEDYVRELGIAESVIFTGFIPIEEAWKIAASAAVCLSPFYPTKILSSTSPTKLVEYLALGRPVVCNNHPEQSRIIEESGAGLCVEWSASSFAEAVLYLLTHAEQAEAMGVKGPAWVKENRTYPIISNQVWNKYQLLLESHK